ncbi:MAG: methyl-accepting chemotaxis protein [Methanosarcinales archaeon]|nr:methyl-accepting chemotaxis protein [Methanosarcinales archaeon]
MAEDQLITEDQRAKLLARLHRHLFWCGERIPDEVEIEGKMVPLHEITWKLITKPKLTEEDREHIDHCIVVLRKKAKSCENYLGKTDMTLEQAKDVFDKTAGLLRAIMDLKDLEELSGPERMKKYQEEVERCKIKDAKSWMNFLAELED